ncbi:hypothetical protein [Streptomyces sp. IBSBF 2950]|uniref:hypothetical protein n=1 Tax=Streptomyces sp. IBSBF 2950 TaxID=2903528 RepID=UPI002FDBCB2C
MPDLTRDLVSAENELARLRGIVAKTVGWIHNPVHDAAARCALAQLLGLPEPSTRTVPAPRPNNAAEASAGVLADHFATGPRVTMVKVFETKEG